LAFIVRNSWDIILYSGQNFYKSLLCVKTIILRWGTKSLNSTFKSHRKSWKDDHLSSY